MSGFKPVRMRDGSSYTGSAQRCYYATAANLFVGDPVTLDANGADANGVLRVTKATAGTAGTIYGIVVGMEPNRDDLTKKYLASGDTGYVMVCTDPNVVYQAQEDGAGGFLALADIGLNTNYVATAGTAATGVSGSELDSSAPVVTATLQFKIIGLAQFEGNLANVGTADAVWECTINTSIANPNSVGI